MSSYELDRYSIIIPVVEQLFDMFYVLFVIVKSSLAVIRPFPDPCLVVELLNFGINSMFDIGLRQVTFTDLLALSTYFR